MPSTTSILYNRVTLITNLPNSKCRDQRVRTFEEKIKDGSRKEKTLMVETTRKQGKTQKKRPQQVLRAMQVHSEE